MRSAELVKGNGSKRANKKVDQQKGRHFRFPNTDAGWATFVQQLRADDCVALEVTGNAFTMHDLLSAYAGKVLRTAKQVTRYAGLDASVHQSGEKGHRGRISRNGCKFLRTALVEAALAVARHDQGPLGAFFHRKQRRIGHHKAVAALARKLLIGGWCMLLTGQPYRAARPLLVQRKQRRLLEVARTVVDWDAVSTELWPEDVQRTPRRRRVA